MNKQWIEIPTGSKIKGLLSHAGRTGVLIKDNGDSIVKVKWDDNKRATWAKRWFVQRVD